MKYILDAENKTIGRIATQAAVFLMGKNVASFVRNKVPEVIVEITNTSKARISDTKRLQKTYSRYSGYPGGLRKPTLKQVVNKKGYSELFKEAVRGMLPKNKLRKVMMNNLKISE